MLQSEGGIEWRGDATNLSVGELVGDVHCPSFLAISLRSVPFLWLGGPPLLLTCLSRYRHREFSNRI